MTTPPHQTADEFPGEDNQELAIDHSDDTDSAFGSSIASDTTSIASQYQGYFKHGRRYQTLADEGYYQPSDDKQWEAMGAGHLLFLILDSQSSNTLFRAPLSPKAQHIMDLGTGPGDWALDVADRFPNVIVHGVDLYPPPQKWVAPNLVFEVDDVTKPWTWNFKFDLVHIRHLSGAMDARQFTELYQRIYGNTAPGGWIEQVEMDIGMYSDDGSLPEDSHINEITMLTHAAAGKAGRPLDIYSMMRGEIEAAGFMNVQQQDYKMPIGTWPQLSTYKDAGRVCKEQWKKGIEGWCMYLFTKFGEPTPWSPEEVQVLLAKAKNELNLGYHIYQKGRRVWAQKPFDKETAPREEPTVKRFASASLSPEHPSKKKQVEEGEEGKQA